MKKTLWSLSVGWLLLFPSIVKAEELEEVAFFPADPETGLQVEVPNPEIQSKQQLTKRQALPEKFDFNDGGFGTPVRNQGNVGICWAYSGADVLSISMKKEFGTNSLISPNYFNYYFADNAFTDQTNPNGEGRPLNGGGNAEKLIMQAALDNMGVTEDVLPTPSNSEKINPMLSQDFLAIKNQQIPMYAEKIAMIPGISYAKGTEEERVKKVNDIKTMVYRHGAATFYYDTKYSHNSNYYNKQTNATYVPIEDIKQGLVPNNWGEWATADHGIVIVGWDDNYSTENFIKKPKKNGAFKVKNSWGEYNHNRGYFYISYEDVYVQNATNLAVDTAEKEYDFNHRYVNGFQYGISLYTMESKELFLGNVFQTGKREEELEAISLYTGQNNIKYELYYLNREIEHDEMIFDYKDMTKIGEGVKEFEGVETVKVPTQKIAPNQEYTIIVKYIYPEDVPYFQLRTQRVKNTIPKLEQGRSFVSTKDIKDEMHWQDISGGKATGSSANLWLNAYTKEKKIAVENIELDLTDVTLNIGEETTLNATILPENATNSKVIWQSSDDSIASISDTGVIKAKKAGNITITAVSEEGQKTAECQVRIGDGKGIFGTVPWTWDEATQTVEFGSGEFPETNSAHNIQTHIESQIQLNGKKIKKIVFAKPVKLGKSASHLFSRLYRLESIEGAKHLNTAETTKMDNMFYYAYNLKQVDVANWDTSQVTTMQNMFRNNKALKDLDVSIWNTSKVKDMSYQFIDTYNLLSIDVSNWDTSQVELMNHMFNGAIKMSSIDVSNWDTRNVTTMKSMFGYDYALNEIDVSKWDVKKVTDLSDMFHLTALTSIDLSNWDTTAVRNMSSFLPNLDEVRVGKAFRFNGNAGLGEKKVFPYSGRWMGPSGEQNPTITYQTTIEFTQMYNGVQAGLYIREKNAMEFGTASWTWDEATQTIMFSSGEFLDTDSTCNIRTNIEAQSRLNGKKIKKIVFTKPVKLSESASYLFSGLYGLESIEGANYLNTTRTTKMDHMFNHTYTLKQVDVANWDTSQVTTMQNMFRNNKALKGIDVSIWNTSKVKDMSYQFMDTYNLLSIDVSNWDTSQVELMNHMFNGAIKMSSIDVSNWDTRNVTTMKSMFGYDYALNEIDVSKWDVKKVTDLSDMFHLTALTSIDLSNWDTTAVRNMSSFLTNIDEVRVGKAFRFNGNAGLGEKKTFPYSGRWTGSKGEQNSKITYATTAEFTQNYDGSQPGTYVREQTK